MYATLSDDELFRLLRAGDEEAFVALYRRRQDGIYRFALRMCGSESIAEDVMQEVFMALMRSDRRSVELRGSFRAYLYGIARNQALRRLEKDRFLAPISDHGDERESSTAESLIAFADPLRDLTRKEMIATVRQAVMALPLHYREVVALCDLCELSYDETAATLGCAVGTVRSRLHRARALLVEKLRAHRDAEIKQADATNCLG
jgi:RNA polymerase sigma-70 factor (ECF subfamily)